SPQALHVIGAPDAASAANFLLESTNATLSVARLSFRVHIANVATVDGQYRELAYLRIVGANTLRIEISTGEHAVENEGTTGTAHYHAGTGFSLADGAWHRVELWVDASASPARVGYSVDGATLLNEAALVPDASAWHLGVVSFR